MVAFSTGSGGQAKHYVIEDSLETPVGNILGEAPATTSENGLPLEQSDLTPTTISPMSDTISGVTYTLDGTSITAKSAKWNGKGDKGDKNIVLTSDGADPLATEFHLENFVHAEVDLQAMDEAVKLGVYDSKRGNIFLTDHDDHFHLELVTNGSGWSNQFAVSTGAGNDIVTVAEGTLGESIKKVNNGEFTTIFARLQAGNDTYDSTGTADGILAADENTGAILAEDQVLGGTGNDTIHTGMGDDSIVGGSDSDVISAGDGNDVVFGDSTAGFGNALVGTSLGDGDVNLPERSAATDFDPSILRGQVNTGVVDDSIDSGDGHDIVNGGLGMNEIWTGEGMDTILIDVDVDIDGDQSIGGFEDVIMDFDVKNRPDENDYDTLDFTTLGYDRDYDSGGLYDGRFTDRAGELGLLDNNDGLRDLSTEADLRDLAVALESDDSSVTDAYIVGAEGDELFSLAFDFGDLRHVVLKDVISATSDPDDGKIDLAFLTDLSDYETAGGESVSLGAGIEIDRIDSFAYGDGFDEQFSRLDEFGMA